ncbi:MAG: UDP-3-O-(3-hydroxymyristoyl)glucosamine N-acyltransferase [Pseudomonadales bacterium]|nr:UDP-3-O-(3-hydroxymyristoyl)glucosamine N-acyltransferase [Pseudomonadales bacterium]
MKHWSLGDLAKELGVTLRGDAELTVSRLATLKSATSGCLSFLANPLYRAQLADSNATAVILSANVAETFSGAVLIADDPYFAYARASHLFDKSPQLDPQVHPTAYVADNVVLGGAVAIGPNAVVEAGVRLADGVSIGPGSVVGEGTVIGANTKLHANVTCYHHISIGERCNIHSGAVIGGDGFGFAPVKDGWFKIAQLGGVSIADDVDIGANTTIDRGALDDTKIGKGVILDNQIQIGHNCEIGDFTAIAGCTGIAGSTKIGRYCTIAGAVGIAGHIEICDKVHLTMRSAITKSITKPGSYSSGTAMSSTAEWRKNAARFRRLDSLAQRLASLERKIGKSDDIKG